MTKADKMDILDYKIRKEVDDDTEFKKNLADYFKFINKFNHQTNPDLYKYFVYDFFHDGEISDLTFSDAFRTLTFKIVCPNLKIGDADNYKYVDASFQCRLGGIAWFHMDTNRINKYNDPLDERSDWIEFYSSEINTLTEQIAFYNKKYKDRRFYSLIIHTRPSDRTFGLIFEYINVMPEEPIALELLLKDYGHLQPLYEKEAQKKKIR
jgi:hypothetical protein